MLVVINAKDPVQPYVFNYWKNIEKLLKNVKGYGKTVCTCVWVGESKLTHFESIM